MDIICISETKLDETFPMTQFAIKGFGKPYHLDITSNSAGLLFYVKANLPSKLIGFYNFSSEIQCILIVSNISTKKYALLSIYRPPNQNINFFLDKLSEAHDIIQNITEIFASLVILTQLRKTMIRSQPKHYTN